MLSVSVALSPTFGESQVLSFLTLKEASELLRRKTVSPVDLTQACLTRIESNNSALNAFITVTKDQAMDAARAMEVEQGADIGEGHFTASPSLKDNIDTAGIRTTAASELFRTGSNCRRRSQEVEGCQNNSAW
jgi:aspartyl-tRNA(Asn)/glutamyl-tRNA(Gln) amidotransferase subunit A